MHRSRGKFVLAVKKTCTGIPLVSYLSLLLLHVCLSLFCSRSLARSLSPTGRHNLACDVHVSVYTCVCGSACVRAAAVPPQAFVLSSELPLESDFFGGWQFLSILGCCTYPPTNIHWQRCQETTCVCVCVCAGRVSVTKGVTADFVPPLLLLVFFLFFFFTYFLVKEQNIPP